MIVVRAYYVFRYHGKPEIIGIVDIVNPVAILIEQKFS